MAMQIKLDSKDKDEEWSKSVEADKCDDADGDAGSSRGLHWQCGTAAASESR